jgi:type VII secretion-associated serine protease mycosin
VLVFGLTVVTVWLPTGPAVAGPAASRAVTAPALLPMAPTTRCGPSSTEHLTQTPWPLQRLQPNLAWPISRGAGVTVAVIDSGVSIDAPALAGQVLPGGRDFLVSGANGTCDEAGHGTFVAGIIAGKDTSDPFTGIAPDAQILPYRVIRSEQSNDAGIPGNIATAIRDAVAKGAKVINLSLVVYNPPKVLTDAVAFAIASNVVLVAAAGNQGSSTTTGQILYPAAYPGVIAVAGTNEKDQHVDSSSEGSYVNVAAPGVNIVGPEPQGGGYAQFQAGGTSFAAAYVSGVAALVVARFPTLTPAQVTGRIEQTADHPAEGWNPVVGYGVVNPYRAVSAVLRTSAPAGNVTTQAPLTASNTRDTAMARQKAIAGGVAAAGLLLALVLLIATPIVRGGRARRWRPGRNGTPPAPPAGSPTASRDNFVPVVGRTMSVTAPTVRRDTGAAATGAAAVAAGRAAPPRGTATPPRR